MAQSRSTHQAPSQGALNAVSRKGYVKPGWELYGFMNPVFILFIAIIDFAFLYLLFIIIRGIVNFFARLFSGNKKIDLVPASAAPPLSTQIEKYPYQKQEYLLTPTELKFYRVLKLICDERDLAILAKVRMEDLVSVPRGIFDDWKWRGYIRSRHIDFVLCDASNLKIRCGVELDDWHHKYFKNHEIDQRKDKIMRDAGLPLIRVPVKENYDIDEIVKILSASLISATIAKVAI